LAQDQARVTIRLKDGRVLQRFISHAVGSKENPMTTAQIEAKFADLASGILSDAKTRRLMELCLDIERVPDAGDIARAARA
jgi:2-methylcitrate dehydratase PrpD